MLAFAMPVPLTRAQVEAVAALAHLELDPAEVELFARQLGDILEYADELQQVDTSGVAPTAYGVARPQRRSAGRRGALARRGRGARQRAGTRPSSRCRGFDGGFFKVPRVIG